MKFHKATNLGIEIEICVEKEKYKSLKTEYNKQIQELNTNLNEAHNIIGLKNLGSKRFTDQNAK